MKAFLGLCGGVCLALAGCSSGGGSDDGGTGSDGQASDSGVAGDSTAGNDAGTDASGNDAGNDAPSNVPPGTIQGIVSRTQGLTFKGDGKGTLWVDIGTSCPYGGGINVTKTIQVMNADLTSPSVMIPFTMTGVAPGTYSIWGWVDDNGDNNPFPMGGDPGNYPMCPQVTLTANAGASTSLVFNGSNWN